MYKQSTLIKTTTIFLSLSSLPLSPLWAMEDVPETTIGGAPKIRILPLIKQPEDPYDKLIQCIFRFLPFEDFLRVSFVSKEWYKNSEEDSVWKVQKAQTKKEWINEQVKQRIASAINNTIEQRLRNKERITLVGHNIHKQHVQYITPLVNKILFYTRINIPTQDQLPNAVAYIMRQISTYATTHNFPYKTEPPEEAGLVIIHPKAENEPKIQAYACQKSVPDLPLSNNKYEIIQCHFKEKTTFSGPTEERIDFMANEIAKNITKEKLEKFVIGVNDFQITEQKIVIQHDQKRPLSKLSTSNRLTIQFPVKEETLTKKVTPNNSTSSPIQLKGNGGHRTW